MRKMKKEGGFTLIEMLIVVAIIAILVAVSIPLFSTSLENAREATDAANERAAKAEILLVYMTGGKVGGVDFDPSKTYYYNAKDGVLAENNTGIDGYGKGTTAGSSNANNKDKIITVKIDDPDGEPKVTLAWA